MIGYSGIKTIVINKVYEEIDTYVVLNVWDGKILSIDSLGVSEAIADDFDAWVRPELLRARLKEKYQSTLTVDVFENASRAVIGSVRGLIVGSILFSLLIGAFLGTA